MPEEKEKLDHIRHSCAHLLAAAVLDLWPGAHNAIGPSIEGGFYQDFDLGDIKISETDFPKIEKRMKRILESWKSFNVREVSIDQARKDFAHNPYKLELIEEFGKLGKTITENNPGNFLDLCKGGHSEDPKQELKFLKLMKVAGAYWRGDESKKMLTRVYGVCFPTAEELNAHLAMLAEAEKRDHKKLGRELGLFAFSPLVGSGLPLFLSKGTVVFTELEKFMKDEKEQRGYQFVRIPHIAKADLYRKSGHLGKYDAMMPIMTDEEGSQYVMKAMNCPHHFELYNAEPHSYRDLPYRIAETTTVYRNEKSGELAGLVRVKSLTQDDTHHFVAHDQIEDEIKMILGLMEKVYSTFGFTDFLVQISVRDPKHPEKYFGDDGLWKKSEQILIKSVKEWGRPYVVEEGEAAFYGPKIDIMVKDSIGRRWQLTTVQLDFNQPENFQLRYVGEDGKEHAPAILHVAILGSIERFMGILIEHFAGAFPLWLAPVQVYIGSVGEAHGPAVRKLGGKLKEEGIRVELDDGADTVGYKIRKAEKQKIPYMLIIGDKEKSLRKLTVRMRGEQKQKAMAVSSFVKQVLKEIKEKK